MKKNFLISLVLVAAAAAVMAFTYPPAEKGTGSVIPVQDIPDLGFPEDIATILQTSCYDCHINSATNAKAKLKLNFSKWNELSDARKVARLEGICKEINKGSMPPSKYVSNNPGAVMSAEQKEAVCNWTVMETKKLMGE